VPKLQAVKNIIARPQAYGATLPTIGNHPFFDTITVERDMDVAVIARLSGVSEADFRALNPSLKHPIVMPAGTPTILLPWDNAIVFQRNLAAHTGPLASWTAWVVPATMSVAQVAQRVGMSEAELRAVNNIPPRMQVKAGSSLLVHRNDQRDRDVPEHVADNATLSLQPEVILRRTVVKARKGETVARLASRYGVSPASVAEWNKLAANAALKPGQKVSLMLPQRVAVAAVDRTKARTSAKVSAKTGAKATATASTAKTKKVASGRVKAERGSKTRVAARK